MNCTTPRSQPQSHPLNCLIVEDDRGFALMLVDVVRDEGGLATACASIQTAREAMARQPYDIVLLDNHLPDGKGFQFHFEISQRDPSLTVIMLTGLPELSQVVELIRNGLFDYLAKPVDRANLEACLRRAFARARHRGVEGSSPDFVSLSAPMREVAQALQQAARHPKANVLLTGETGVGKDLAARALHRWTFGERHAEVPLIALNCAAVPAEMFEAELFGAERGSYTGADRTREGLVTAARGGTLFLDEIAEVPLASQAKLLRFLESREYRLLGSTSDKRFDGRIIAATNKDLRQEASAGRFREDLLYRLDVFTVAIPPLRQRPEEIAVLVDVLLAGLARKYGRQAPQLKPADLGPLQAYKFPGNVRELRNLLERSFLRTAPDAGWLALDMEWLRGSSIPPLPSGAHPSPQPAPQSQLQADTSEGRHLSPIDQQEYQLIRRTLIEEKGGIRRTAARLGITHQALLRRLQKWPELRQGFS